MFTFPAFTNFLLFFIIYRAVNNELIAHAQQTTGFLQTVIVAIGKIDALQAL